MEKKRLQSIVIFIFSIYFFIISIELIKKSSLSLGDSLINHFITLSQSPIKALAAGWLGAGIVQSGGAIGAITATMVGAGIFTLTTAIFIIFGSRIGATITGLIVSLFSKTKNKRDFRHGFEIATANTFYNIINIIILFLIEYFFRIFTKIGTYFGKFLEGVTFFKAVPDLIDIIAGWFIKLIMQIPAKIAVLIIGFVILLVTLEFLAKSILGIFGGHDKARKIVKKHFSNKYEAFLIGLLITALIPSTNITISFLIPLAVARIINIEEAIPYILGANIGTVVEVVLAAFVTGNSLAIATATIYVLFSMIGALVWLPNTKLLYKITKYMSKHLLNITREKAIIYVMIFIFIPLMLLF